MAESCVGAVAALVVTAYGTMGDRITSKHSMNIFSGAFITIGHSMLAAKGPGLPLITSRLIEGFGVGVILSTLPAYASEPGYSLFRGAFRAAVCAMLGAIAIKHVRDTCLVDMPSLSPQELHVGLALVAVIMLYTFKTCTPVSEAGRSPGSNTSMKASLNAGDLNTAQGLPHGEHARMETDGEHPYDYYFKPGDKLRPPPARTLDSPEWLHMRSRLLSRYIDVRPIPNRTPKVEMMQDHFWQGDEYMDPVIALGRRVGMGKVRAMVLQALSNGIKSVADAPEEIVNLFEHLDRKPSWFDEEKFERGRVVLANTTSIGRLTALAMNFIITAQAASVSNAVGSTGQYTNPKTVMRRHLETAHFFHRISLLGGSQRFSETFKEVVKVRFMHGQIRSALKKRWEIDTFANHGNPISNTDMALGIIAFGVQNLLGDIAFGKEYSTNDLDAVVHYWEYIGYVFGISENIIPRSFQEGVEQFDYILSTHGYAPDWSPIVADSLLIVPEEAILLVGNSFLQAILSYTVVPFFHGLLYYFSGDNLGYNMLSTRYKSRVRMRIQAIYAVILGTVFVNLSTLLGELPGREARMIKHASHGSPSTALALRLIEMMAQKAGVRSVTFETHDGTISDDLKPIKA